MTQAVSLNRSYWQRYYDRETIAQSDALRQSFTIESTGVDIHIDVYEQADKNVDVLIFNHGGGGYSRFFVPLALTLHARGYTIILPDQRGQGYSGGDRGDFTIGQFVQNIVDVLAWTRTRYTGRIFLGGASVGGGLAYKAAVQAQAGGLRIDGVISHNLYNFGDPHDALAVSRMAALRHLPGVAWLSGRLITLAGSLLPRFKVPFALLGRFDKMVDERDTSFYGIWKADPLPIKRVSLRYMRSTFNTPPVTPYRQNTLPILVINQTRDRMVHPSVTRRNYEKLAGPKQYVEIDYGHWATGEQFTREYAEILDRFMRETAR